MTPYIGISNFEPPINLIILEIDTIFSDGKAQVVYCSLFGLLDEKYVTVGTVVLKRRQGIPLEQASQADGNIVDLIPQNTRSRCIHLCGTICPQSYKFNSYGSF